MSEHPGMEKDVSAEKLCVVLESDDIFFSLSTLQCLTLLVG